MAEGRHQLTRTRAALLVAAALAASGCAPTGGPGPATGPRAPGPAGEAAGGGLSAAGSALVVQSRNERRTGDYARAAATLERALSIEPNAPAIWLELARVRLSAGEYAQAEQLARKARSLAGGGTPLAEESRAVLAEALRRQGRDSEALELSPPSG